MTIDLKSLTETSLSVAVSENPIALDAQTVESLIARLVRARAKMKPEVAASWAGGQKVKAVIKPNVTIESEQLEAFVLVHLREPGLGWMHYAFPRDQALEPPHRRRVRQTSGAVMKSGPVPPGATTTIVGSAQ